MQVFFEFVDAMSYGSLTCVEDVRGLDWTLVHWYEASLADYFLSFFIQECNANYDCLDHEVLPVVKP
jgi:hypothetical protein